MFLRIEVLLTHTGKELRVTKTKEAPTPTEGITEQADEPRSLFICVGRKEKGLVKKIREYLDARNSAFRKVFSEMHRSGGESGDLHEEIAQLDAYAISNGAHLQLYIVTDDSTNGYAELVSVLFPHEHTDSVRALVKFLTELGLVTNHLHLRERPAGFKSYQSYLDKYHDENEYKKPFWTG